jgi:trimethylamine--corrinoid protein Co-methyltransferase
MSGEVMGGTAPATIAGGLITNIVEITAPLVLAQLIRPGTRIIVKDFSFAMNMATGSPLFGSIEAGLHNAAFAQYFRRFGVPVDGCTAYPNAKRPDYQGGYEKAFRALIAGVTGVNTLLLHGSVHGELTFHPVQAVLDDDVAGMVERFMKNFTVNEETLAISLIEKVGPIPGHYLSEEHTRKWWQLEQYTPKAADRLTYPSWIQTGKKSSLELAKERTEEILATHKTTPLSASQEEDLERILEEARQYYKGKDLISDEEMATYRQSLKSPNYPYG